MYNVKTWEAAAHDRGHGRSMILTSVVCPSFPMMTIFRGAGWCMTSVFLVLMLKPKLSQALEK